jgi:hypothetical protein
MRRRARQGHRQAAPPRQEAGWRAARLLVGVVLALAATSAPVHAAPPELAVYVTDADEDVYVALYGNLAVELAACDGAVAARGLLQLPAEVPARETTLANLRDNFALGSHPRIPCGSGASFDLDWAATTPIWADLEGSGSYLLPAPGGSGSFYALPTRCTGIKTALAIRERLQLPGVLQGFVAPAGAGAPLLLDCGAATGQTPETGETSSAAPALSLHRFETFLSAESTGDTIFVARFLPGGVTNAGPIYLPIWRVDGRAVAELLLAGGDAAAATEAALEGLFGLSAAAAVTQLGFEAVAAVRSAVHVDLCLESCAGYVHRHAAFASPGIDLGLTELSAGTVARRLGRLGEEQLVWAFTGNREAVFTSCDRVAAALGLPGPAAADWLTAVEAAVVAEAGAASGFVCQQGATCLRRIADGAPLTQAAFAAGADCAGARRLRVELPGAVQTSAPLSLTGTDFDAIELAPRPGVPRAVVTATPGRQGGGSASCLLSSTEALIFADRLPRLQLRDLSLRRAAGAGSAEVVALQVQSGALVLDQATLGGDAEGTQPLSRGVTLCLADLYADESTIDADSLGVQSVSARILLAGSAANPALIAGPRFGLLLSADSTLRLHHARLVARTPLVLRGGRAVATRTELSPGEGLASESTALVLERSASATFTIATVNGFRCVASFADAGSRASFVLPGNDLTRDNTHLACGAPGQFTLLE